MNKLVIGLLVSVCLLGFVLILLNEHMGSDIAATAPEKTPPVVAADVATKESAPKPQIAQNNTPAPKPLLPETTNNSVPQKVEELASAEVPPASEELKIPSAVEQDAVILPTPAVDLPPVDVKPVEEQKTTAPAIHEKTEQAKVEKSEIVPVAKIETKEKPVESRQAVAPETKKVETPVKQEKISPAPVQPVEPKEKSATTATKTKTAGITLFTVLVRENGATVRLRANVALPFSASQLQKPEHIVKQLQNPERLMFDLTGVWDLKDPGVPNNIIVNKVRVGKMADRMRIVVDLKDKPKRMRVKVTDRKDGLDIFLDR